MDLGLAGKVAAITGGSAGIGRAAAHRLCEEGLRVAICARREHVLQTTAQEIASAPGGEVLAVRADVTNPADCAEFMQQTIARFGRLKSAQWTRRWQAHFSHMPLDECYAKQGELIPLRRLGEAEDVADLVCFLASEHARYITGTAINIDVGLSGVV